MSPKIIDFNDLNVEYQRKDCINYVKKMMPSKERIMTLGGFDVHDVHLTYGKEFTVWISQVISVILKEYEISKPYVITRHYTKSKYTEVSFVENLKLDCNCKCKESVDC